MPRYRPINVMSPSPNSRLPKGALLEVSGHPHSDRLASAEVVINQMLQAQAVKLLFQGPKLPVWNENPGAIAAFEDQGEGRWALKINALNQAHALAEWSKKAPKSGIKLATLTWDFSTSVRKADFCATLRDRVAAKLDATVSVAPPPLTLRQKVRQLLGFKSIPAIIKHNALPLTKPRS